MWGGITVAVLLALLIGAAFIPRWWAHRVGDQANESFTGGIMLGLFYGFVFTVLPLLLIVWGIRRRRSGRMWLWILAGAILLALPNIFTLGIVLGPGGGAHAGDRTFDVDAPGFGTRRWRERCSLSPRSASSGTCCPPAAGRETSHARMTARSVGGQACLDVPSHPRPSGSARLPGRRRGSPLPDGDPRRHPLRLGGRPALAGLERAGLVVRDPRAGVRRRARSAVLPPPGPRRPLAARGVDSANSPVELPSILLAGLATLGLGLVLGPEAPLIALGLGLGAIAVRLVRLEQTEAQLLVLAGAFAAIAALFGGPLAASLMLLELVAMSGAIPAASIVRALLPGFVAAGTGALVFTGVGDWRGLHPGSLALPPLPAYDSVRLADLAWGIVLSVVIAGLVVGIRHLAHEVGDQGGSRLCSRSWSRALSSECSQWSFGRLADRPVDLVLFSGQAEMPAVIAEGSASVLLLLVAAKGLAYALSLGAGFRGGPVFPALAIGVALEMVAADVLPGLDTTPAVAIGLAAGTAAVLRAPFTAVLLATLLLGSSA